MRDEEGADAGGVSLSAEQLQGRSTRGGTKRFERLSCRRGIWAVNLRKLTGGELATVRGSAVIESRARYTLRGPGL